MKEKTNNQTKEKKNPKFIYSKQYITNIENPTKEDLKNIFNKKYFNYINKIENRKSRAKYD